MQSRQAPTGRAGATKLPLSLSAPLVTATVTLVVVLAVPGAAAQEPAPGMRRPLKTVDPVKTPVPVKVTVLPPPVGPVVGLSTTAVSAANAGVAVASTAAAITPVAIPA